MTNEKTPRWKVMRQILADAKAPMPYKQLGIKVLAITEPDYTGDFCKHAYSTGLHRDCKKHPDVFTIRDGIVALKDFDADVPRQYTESQIKGIVRERIETLLETIQADIETSDMTGAELVNRWFFDTDDVCDPDDVLRAIYDTKPLENANESQVKPDSEPESDENESQVEPDSELESDENECLVENSEPGAEIDIGIEKNSDGYYNWHEAGPEILALLRQRSVFLFFDENGDNLKCECSLRPDDVQHAIENGNNKPADTADAIFIVDTNGGWTDIPIDTIYRIKEAA